MTRQQNLGHVLDELAADIPRAGYQRIVEIKEELSRLKRRTVPGDGERIDNLLTQAIARFRQINTERLRRRHE